MALNYPIDIISENFDGFFHKESEKLTPQAKEQLPRELVFKVFRGIGNTSPTSISKLNFLNKLYILWKAMGKRWFIVIEDEVGGIGINEFSEIQKHKNKKEFGLLRATELATSGMFVLGNKELSAGLSYLNKLGASASYNYLIKAKNIKSKKGIHWNDKMQYVAKFLSFWEGHKKKFIAEMGISIPEIYVLLYVYSQGKEVAGAVMYREIYRQAFHSSPAKIKTAFSSLQQRQYLIKNGSTKKATMQITALGAEAVNNILTKYALNC